MCIGDKKKQQTINKMRNPPVIKKETNNTFAKMIKRGKEGYRKQQESKFNKELNNITKPMNNFVQNGVNVTLGLTGGLIVLVGFIVVVSVIM